MYHLRTAGIGIAAVIVVSLLAGQVATHAAGPYEAEGLEPFDAGRFITPVVCGGCHAEIYGMWDGTMHSKAFDDPLFRAASKSFLLDAENEGERADAEHCVACHNPIAYRSGQIPGSSADYGNTTDVTKYAISCDLCHSMSEIVELGNASFNTEPGNGSDDPGVKRGPRDDAEPLYHRAAYSEIHVSPEICGSCHNVTHLSYGTQLEGTYDEWLESPYNADDPSEKVVCQDCHMRQTKGNPATGMTERPDYPGRASPMSRERPHIYRHSVTGANAYLPQLLDVSGVAGLALERLTHAAVIELHDIGSGPDGGWGFTVRVRNEGAGHLLPTGVSEYRQVWLEITVTDANGSVVFSSGVPQETGALPDETVIFNTVFGDSGGNPTMNVARAAVVLHDRRVPPKGYLDQRFALPSAPASPCTVRAVLNYRSIDPAIARLLLGDDAAPVPVIPMAGIEETVR